MEYSFVAFLLIFIPNPISALTASACYGSNGDCNFLHLECSNRRTIQILSAQYLFTKNVNCTVSTSCENKNSRGCCKPHNVHRTGKNFSEEHTKSLLDTCSSKPSCTHQSPFAADNGSSSSLVEVKFSCINENDQNQQEDNTTPDPRPESLQESLQDSDNTAVIVVPIVVVLLAVVIAAVLFIYWRKKKQRQTDKPANTGNGVLHRAVHNDGYLQTDASNEPDTDPENTYHTIDLNSLPGETADDAGPQDDYNMIDPSKLDYETPANHDYLVLEPETGGAAEARNEDHIETETENNKMNHDYFILEPETGGTMEDHNETETEYNRINLESNEVVNDPSYHRLGSLEHSTGDKHGETDDSYSHIENGHHNKDNETRTIDAQTMHQQEVLNDDYSHLNS